MSTRIATAITVLLVGLGALLGAGPATADDAAADPPAGTTWSLQPASSEAADGRVSLRQHVDPGATVDEHLALTNHGADAARFAVYASDGVVTDRGSFDLLPSDQAPTDGGSWVAFGDVAAAQPRDGGGFTIDVAGGASIIIPIRIAVPSDAAPGDHPAGIVAELLADAQTQVHLSTRVGVRLHLRVSGEVVASLAAKDVDVQYRPSANPLAPGAVALSFDIANRGNVRLAASSTVTLTGPFGMLPVRADIATGREILPGQTAHAEASLPVWPLLLGFGEITLQPQPVGSDEIDVALRTSTTAVTVWTPPWIHLGVLLLAVLAWWLIRRQRKRSAARVQAAIDAAVAAARTSEREAIPA
jgi:hypothetical protein